MLIKNLAAGAPTLSRLSTELTAGPREKPGVQDDRLSTNVAATNRLRLQPAATNVGDKHKALQSALNKMSSCLTLLAGAEVLDSAVAELMREQGEQTADTLDSAQRKIKDTYGRMKQQTVKKREAAERRREAEEDKGAWDSFVNLFKKVVDVGVAAASAVAGGPLGATAAVLKISSLVIGETCKDSTAGRWLGLGVGVAGGLVGAAGRGGASNGAQKVGDAVNEGIQGIGYAKIGGYQADAQEADAEIAAIRAERRRALSAAEREQETIKTIVEVQTRGLKLATRVLRTNQAVIRAAIR